MAAFLNREVRKKDKKSIFISTTLKALAIRETSFNHRKGKRDFERSKTGGHEELKKNQCTFCREEGH